MNRKKITSMSIALALAVGIFSGLTVHAEQYYPDVDEGHWAYEWVDYMHEHGYIHGYPDGNYRPGQNITRAEYVTILNYIFNPNGSADKNYVDVHEGDWYYDIVQSAVNAGYLHGYDDATEENDGTMKPNNYITREEAAVIAADAYGLVHNSDVSKFSDADDISWWAVPYVGALLGDAVLLGDADTSAFRPKDNMLRAEVASMIAQAEKKRENGELTLDEKITLPASLTEDDGVYTLKDIQTKNLGADKPYALTVDAVESGDMGEYKFVAAIDGVIFADGVTLEGLNDILDEKTFTPDELENLTIDVTGFEDAIDGSALTITVSATDGTTGEKVYDTKSYTITAGETEVEWPSDFTGSGSDRTLGGFSTNYSGGIKVKVKEDTNGDVGDHTYNITIDGAPVADGVTAEELNEILNGRELTDKEFASMIITVTADSPENGSALEITLDLEDAETAERISERKYVIRYNRAGGSTISGGSGTTTPVSNRDRVVESLNEYQGNSYTNFISDPAAWSKDKLMIVLTNDGLTLGDTASQQTSNAANYSTVYNSIKASLGDTDDHYSKLKTVYEDVIRSVVADTNLPYKTVITATTNKAQYVYLFRAMVATINGAADAAVSIYNDPANANKSADTLFEMFKIEAANNTLNRVNTILDVQLADSNITDTSEIKAEIVEVAVSYVNGLFNGDNTQKASVKSALESAAKPLTLESFANILSTYINQRNA